MKRDCCRSAAAPYLYVGLELAALHVGDAGVNPKRAGLTKKTAPDGAVLLKDFSFYRYGFGPLWQS